MPRRILMPKKGKEKNRRKRLQLSGAMVSSVIQKCTHCEVTETPQWREGPLGPKTLCNACGVRYRKRQLFPEYRPAASPTFIPSLHSNSHKKVVQMRKKAADEPQADLPQRSFARPYNKINMVEPGCWDEDFESMLNCLDFPLESLEEDGLSLDGDWDPSMCQFLGPIPSDALMALPPVVRGDISTSCLKAHAVVRGDIPTSCLNALSNSNVPNNFPEAKGSVLFQSESPVSVLEQSSSSCSGGKSTFFKFGSKRRRSKRARSSLNPWILMGPLSCTAKKKSDGKKGKEKKSKGTGGMESSSSQKCAHCEVSKTTLWREGPLGPKTLCNACGVRYRRGQLFPQYRPAASPTFVPSLHSNSHRKVIELIRKAVEEPREALLDQKYVTSLG